MCLYINILNQGLINLLYKGLDNKDFRLCGPYSLLELVNPAICSRRTNTDNA